MKRMSRGCNLLIVAWEDAKEQDPTNDILIDELVETQDEKVEALK
jgi:hypothetical protein